MKILVISHMYPSPSNPVAGIFVHEQVKALRKNGLDVRVIAPRPWVPFPVNYFKSKWIAYSRIPPYMLWEDIEVYNPFYLVLPKGYLFASSGIRMFWGIKNVVMEIRKQFSFDIIHSHVALPDGYAGMLLAKQLSKPLIVTVHGQDFNQTIFKTSSCRQAVRRTLRFSHRTIVVSNKLRKVALEQKLSSPEQIITINNGFDPESLSTKTVPPVYNNQRKKQIILSVSNLIQSKGIDLNLRAMHQLKKKYPNIYYVIVGAGPAKGKLKNLISDLGLTKYVKFVGRQDYSETMRYMASCDVFSLPSWLEGFGVVYLEAMAHGKPVIACKGEGIEDVIEHGSTGLLVEPKSVTSLAMALDFLLSHSHEANAMGKRAQQLVLNNYSWNKNAEETIAIYNQIFHLKK